MWLALQGPCTCLYEGQKFEILSGNSLNLKKHLLHMATKSGQKLESLFVLACGWPLRGRTHVRIKGQNLNFYLETHATSHNIHTIPHNIYFMRLRILPRILGTLYWRVDDPLGAVHTPV